MMAPGKDESGEELEMYGSENVVLPPPDDTKTRNLCTRPSSDLIPIYLLARRYEENIRRKMYFAAAEPGWLVARIASFLRVIRDPEQERKVMAMSTLFDNGHLVYLLDLPGNGNLAVPSERTIDLGKHLTSFEPAPLLTLGTQSRLWVTDNLRDTRTVLSFPEPLGNDPSWDPKMLEKMRRSQGLERSEPLSKMLMSIDELVHLCSGP